MTLKQFFMTCAVSAGSGLFCWSCTGPGLPKETKVLNIKAFGAIGDGVADDSDAMRRAILAAIEKGRAGGCTLFLPSGTYALATPFGTHQMLEFKNARNVTIQGEENVKILVRDPEYGFIRFEGGENVTLRDFAVDYSPLTFSQLKVESVLKGESGICDFVLKTEDGFPDLELPHFARQGSDRRVFMAYTAGRKLNLRAPLLACKKLTKIADRTFQVSLAPMQGSPAFVTEGDIIVVASRIFGKALFSLDQVERPTLENIKAHASPELFLLSYECESLLISNCWIAPPEHSSRILSTSADGAFIIGGRKGPTIEKCVFSGNGDDSINIHTTGGLVYGFASDEEVVVTETPWGRKEKLWRIGDTVELYNDKLEIVFSAKIAGIVHDEKTGGGTIKIKFTPNGEGVRCASGLIKGHPVSVTTYPNIIAFNADKCGNHFVITDNTFANHRGRGVLVQSRSGRIEGNSFNRMDGGIWLLGEWFYKDGPLAKDIVIKGNTLTNLGWEISHGAIGISAGESKAMDFSNIVIEDNVFSNCLRPAIYINNAYGVTIKGNKITHLAPGSPDNQIVVGRDTQDIRVVK